VKTRDDLCLSCGESDWDLERLGNERKAKS
jgi:hypothetical protein